MFQLTDKQYEDLKQSAQKIYASFKPVKCKAINEYVHFTSVGFNHIIYKRNERGRERKDQIMRLKCLDLARKILELTTTIQEKEETYIEVMVKMKKRREMRSKPVKYYGFIAIMHNKKVKVIVKKIGEGNYFFWSIIPFWSTTKHGDMKFRDFATGNLEED